MLLETQSDPLMPILIGLAAVLVAGAIWYEVRQYKRRKAARNSGTQTLVSEPQPITDEEVSQRSSRREAAKASRGKSTSAAQTKPVKLPAPPPDHEAPTTQIRAKAPRADGPPESDVPTQPVVKDQVVEIAPPVRGDDKPAIQLSDVRVDPNAPPVERPKPRVQGLEILDVRLPRDDRDQDPEEDEPEEEAPEEPTSSESSIRSPVPEASENQPEDDADESTILEAVSAAPGAFNDIRDLDDLEDAGGIPEIRAGVPALSARRPEVPESGGWVEVGIDQDDHEEEYEDQQDYEDQDDESEQVEYEEDDSVDDDRPIVRSDYAQDEDDEDEEEDWQTDDEEEDVDEDDSEDDDSDEEEIDPQRIPEVLDPNQAWATARRRIAEEDDDGPVIEDEPFDWQEESEESDAPPAVRDVSVTVRAVEPDDSGESDDFDLIKIARKSAQMKRVQAEEEAKAAASSSDQFDEDRYDLHKQNLRIVRRGGVARIEQDTGEPVQQDPPAAEAQEPEPEQEPSKPSMRLLSGHRDRVEDPEEDADEVVSSDSLRSPVTPPAPPQILDVTIHVSEEDAEDDNQDSGIRKSGRRGGKSSRKGR